MIDALDLAVGEHGAGVEEVAIEMRDADEAGDSLRLARDQLEALPGRAQEARSQEQVLRRIAGDGQLREEREVGTLVPRSANAGENALAVAVDVADDGVDLRESEPHYPEDSDSGSKSRREATAASARRRRCAGFALGAASAA